MQSYDQSGKLLETRQLDEEELGQAVQQAMSKPEVANVTVGRLPRKGDEVIINGLRFDVMFVDDTHGIFKMRIGEAQAMNEHGILFDGRMMLANLAGTKTMTRRTRGLERINQEPGRWHLWYPELDEPGCATFTDHPQGEKGEVTRLKCPYGKPGDRLWARESFAPQCADIHSNYREGDPMIYRADYTGEALEYPWRPSIFMPRWASRFTPDIVSVRAERVRDIRAFDACAEGIDKKEAIRKLRSMNGNYWSASTEATFYKDEFRALWDSINTKRGLGWDFNPWVWVIGYSSSKTTVSGDATRAATARNGDAEDSGKEFSITARNEAEQDMLDNGELMDVLRGRMDEEG